MAPHAIGSVGEVARQRIRRLVRLGQTIFASYAALVFSTDTEVGVLLFGASWFDPTAGLAGLVSTSSAQFVAARLGYRSDLARNGFYATNALLCGLALGHARPLSWAVVGYAVLLGVLAALVMATLSDLFHRVAQLPVLALPFVVTTTALWPAMGPYLGHGNDFHFDSVPDFPVHFPRLLEFMTRSAGAIVFQPTTSAGLVVLLAILLSSRLSAGFGFFGVGLALSVADYAFPLANPAWLECTGYNALLTGMALGAVFFVPSVWSLVWAGVGAVVVVPLTMALGSASARIGLPVLAWPFVLVTLIALRALALRHPNRAPHTPPLAATPEDNLRYVGVLRSRFGYPGPTRVGMPTTGTWTITQGFDGEHTHKGALRHALDFEILDQNGFPFRGDGIEASDYYCFGQPVHAPLAGTVVFEFGGHEDNRPGQQNLTFPFGNVVVLRHATDVFSVLAHLQQGSIVVRAGQYVAAGEVIGRCGSSGRSPRPHLHLQLQAQADIGTPTIPFELSHYAVARSDDAEYFARGQPRTGDRLSGGTAHSTPELDLLRVGEEFWLDARGRALRIRSELSPLGERSLVASDGGRLHFSSLDGVATFGMLSAPYRSPLAAIALALPRVPPFAGTVVSSEQVPLEWVLPSWLRPVTALVRILGLPAELVGTTRVTRSESEVSSQTRYRHRWLSPGTYGVTASIRIINGRIVSLNLIQGKRVLVQTAGIAPRADQRMLHGRAAIVGSRSRLRLLAVPVIACVAGLSLLLSSTYVKARSVPEPLADSYRFESSGDLTRAIDAAALAVAQKPTQYFPLLRLAYLEYSARRYDSAASHYEAAAGMVPKAIEPRIGLLLARVANGEYEPALEAAETALALDPQNYIVRSRKAWSLYELGRYASALAEYSALVESYPGDIEMRLGRAYSLYGSKRPVEAAMEFREILKRAPLNRKAQAALGIP